MKKHTNSTPVHPRVFTRAMYVYLALFAVIAAGWLYVYHRYQLLNFMEDGQLFRTDRYYLQDYLSRPGGLTRYASAFFTQSYHYFVVGAVLLAVTICSAYWLFWKICRRTGTPERFFILPFIIPAGLLMACSDNLHFRSGNVLGVVWVLVLFWLYLKFLGLKGNKGLNLNTCHCGLDPQSPVQRLLIGILAYLAAYFVAGGNAILLAALIVIDELFSKKESDSFMELRVKPAMTRFLTVLAMIALAVLVPYLSYRWLYVALLHESYLSLTPFDLVEVNRGYYAAWLSIPVLYALWRGITLAPAKRPWIWIALGLVTIFPTTYYELKKVTDLETEYVMRIAYEVERGNWNKVLELGKKEGMKNAVALSYFTNIALSEKGILASEMFSYPQTGTYGLFITKKNHYTTSLYVGELFYRLGMIQEAEHEAFEALVVSPTEHGAKPLRRLVYTTMLRRDTPGFEKYIALLEQSPIYHKWAKKQRVHYQRYLADPAYKIPGAPRSIAASEDALVDYSVPFHNMEAVLAKNPGDKKAFEYFMMFFLAHQDLISFVKNMDIYWPTMHYATMPRHLEEALLIYAIAANQQEEIMTKYPISKASIERFVAYNNALDAAKSQTELKRLKKLYGNTYFYYHLNTEHPMLLEEIEKISAVN